MFETSFVLFRQSNEIFRRVFPARPR